MSEYWSLSSTITYTYLDVVLLGGVISTNRDIQFQNHYFAYRFIGLDKGIGA